MKKIIKEYRVGIILFFIYILLSVYVFLSKGFESFGFLSFALNPFIVVGLDMFASKIHVATFVIFLLFTFHFLWIFFLCFLIDRIVTRLRKKT